MLKKVAIAFGVVMLLVGVLGFIPGITTSDDLLLGIFKVNAIHNIIHLLTGAVALYVGLTSYKSSRVYFQIFGIVYALVAILGFFYGDGDILGIVSSNLADTILHIVIAAVALYFGFASSAEEMTA